MEIIGVAVVIGLVIGVALLARREERRWREADRMDGVNDDYDAEAVDTDRRW